MVTQSKDSFPYKTPTSDMRPEQDENDDCQTGQKRPSGLELGPRKKACFTDPLVHQGRHFGRTIHAMCNFQTLLSNGALRVVEMATRPLESFTPEERQEYKVFRTLVDSIPGLEGRLVSADELISIAEHLWKGASGARGDDTKSLKGAILDWITPKGQTLTPPISRNVKIDRGFNHERTGALLCPTGLDWSDQVTKDKLRSGELQIRGDHWPIFIYAGYTYDPEDPWNGLLRSPLLVCAYKHIFTSPSSVDKEPKATRSGNARIHGMTCATPGSIAYVATQVRFALASSPVFSRTDTATDSETFYQSILELLNDSEEAIEVRELLVWWNRQIFPNYASARRLISKDSAFAKIRARRSALKAIQPGPTDDIS